MLRLRDCDDPLLGRPLALYDTYLDDETLDGESLSNGGKLLGVDLVYLVLGKMTRKLPAVQPGQSVEIWGPLGNGFPVRPARHLVMVAGGIGQTPFVAMTREALGTRSFGDPPRAAALAQPGTLCYGVRTKDLAAGVSDFEEAGAEVRLSSDDGSLGHHGLVTDLLSELLRESTEGVRVVTCGPEPMMEAVAKIAREHRTPCDVSLETPMACGLGICFSCVTRVLQADGQWDYKRTCVDGPVFDAEKIVW